MAVPGKGHEYIGDGKEYDSFHIFPDGEKIYTLPNPFSNKASHLNMEGKRLLLFTGVGIGIDIEIDSFARIKVRLFYTNIPFRYRFYP